MRGMRHAGNALVDFFVPRNCVACGKPGREWRAPLCPTCEVDVQSLLIPAEARPALRGVLSTSEAVDAVFGLYAYRDDRPIRGLIHAMKYRGAQSLCTRLGVRIGEALRGDARSPRVELLIPVPIHPARKRERRFNQSSLLAAGLGGVIGIPVDESALIRVRKTPPQAFLGAREREENMRSAFALRSAPREGVCVGLVDDVVTTGATVSSCARLLKTAGASRVVVLCVAVAQADRLLPESALEIVADNP